jgi:hypothetical protein
MSKSLFFFLLIAAVLGYYLYKTNRFTDIRATFDHLPEGISVTARDRDLHDCKLNLTYDYSVDLPYLRQNSRMMIGKYDFKQWNGTILESVNALGPEIEFRMRCKEGSIDFKETNRYYRNPGSNPD